MISAPGSNPTDASSSRLGFALTLTAIACSLFYNGSHHHLYEISAISAILAAALALRDHSGETVPVTAPGLLLLGFFLWSALTVGWSQAPYVSLVELGTLGAGVSLYLATRLRRDERYTHHCLRFFLALGTATAVAMALQSVAGFPPEAMFVNANTAAALLNLLWPLAAVRWLATNASLRHAGAMLMLAMLMLFAVGLTGSRGALIAGLTALAIIVLVGGATRHHPRRALTLAAAALIALSLSNLIGGGEVATGVRSLAEPGAASASRIAIWTAAWEMIQQRPWLGYGPGVFFLAYPAFRLPGDFSAGFFAHNDYLEFWLERGIVGLLLIAATGITCCWLFWRQARASRDRMPLRDQIMQSLPAFAALASIGVHGLFSYNLQLMPFLVILGIRLAEFEQGVDALPLTSIRLPRIRGRILPSMSLWGFVALAAWQFGAHALYFDRMDRGMQHLRHAQFSEAADRFSLARTIWSLPDTAWYMQANTHLMALAQNPDIPADARKRLVVNGLELLDEAEERNRVRPAIPLIRGLFRANHPEFATGSAEAAFRRALAIDPRTIEARYALSQLLARNGQNERALELVEDGLRLYYRERVDISPLIRRSRELDGSAPADDQSSSVPEAADLKPTDGQGP